MNAVVREFWSALNDAPKLVRLYFAPLVAVVKSVADGANEISTFPSSTDKAEDRPPN